MQRGSRIDQVYTEDFVQEKLDRGAEGIFADRFPDAGRRMEVAAVRNAIDRLPDAQQRRVLQLTDVDGLEQREAAAALGLSKARVCGIHKEASETLRRLLIVGSAFDSSRIESTLSELESETDRRVLESLYVRRLEIKTARASLGLSAQEFRQAHQRALEAVVAAVRGENEASVRV